MGFSDVMKKVYPFITAAAAIGGPLGTMAAKAVGNAIGIDKVPPTTGGIADAIAGAMMNPDQRIALQKAEEDFQLQMASLNLKSVEDLEQIAASDRASARNREIEVKDWMPKALGIGACILFAGALVMLKFGLAETGKDAMLLLLGVLGKMVSDVFAYYFGSSQGSDKKTQIMADAAATAAGKP